jgi:hypothetical protein
MVEEPLQNGSLPLLIVFLVTSYGVFLNSARSSYMTLHLPLSTIFDMCYNKTKLSIVGKKTK